MESSSSSSPGRPGMGEKHPAGEVQTVSREKEMDNAEPINRPPLGQYLVVFFLFDIPSLLFNWLLDFQRILSYGARNYGYIAMIFGLICAMGSGVVCLAYCSHWSSWPAGQALPLMNIVFGKLVGDFNQYFVPESGLDKQTFKNSVNKSRWAPLQSTFTLRSPANIRS